MTRFKEGFPFQTETTANPGMNVKSMDSIKLDDSSGTNNTRECLLKSEGSSTLACSSNPISMTSRKPGLLEVYDDGSIEQISLVDTSTGRDKVECRDIIVTESCQMRTVIDNNNNKKVRNAQLHGGSPNKNKRCKVISSKLGERVWSDHHPYYYHHHNITNSNCLRTFIISVIVFLLSCTTSITLVHGQPPPLPPAGFLDFDNLPVTRFSCEGKVIGGYYADVETGCQMFHVCTLGQKDEIQDIKFLCLNGTVFDQETRVCERVDEVDCSKAEQFFDLNLDLYVPHATTQKPEEADLEEEDDIIRPVATTKPKVTTTTTKATTTTTPTTTQSPRTRPPSTSAKSRPAPVVSSSSQEEDEEDGNGYTAFNYYLKTPHSHVASGYNSQSRQSYIINQPGPSIGRSSSGSSSSSTGRKVPSGQKTIVFTSSSTTSSSTQRPKTVVVVKATLPPAKSTVKSKTLPPRATTTSTPPSPKFELEDQYDEYYDDEDYPEQPPSASAAPSNKQSSYQNHQQGVLHSHYGSPKPSLVSSSGFDFRDGRSTKGVANAGSVSTTTGKSNTGSESKSRQVSIPASHTFPKQTPKQSIVPPVKVISTEFIGNNSTEEPYYYEDDYPDDVTLQQQQLQPGISSSTVKSAKGKGSSELSSTTASSLKSGKGLKVPLQKDSKQQDSSATSESDYYDDDSENVNAHDHHFTHVDVPRIPFAKPNVPRVLVTNGKPFLPRLRRQSHHHYYYPQYPQTAASSFHPSGFLLPASPSGPLRRSAHTHNLHGTGEPLPFNGGRGGSGIGSTELRREARAKARDWGRDTYR